MFTVQDRLMSKTGGSIVPPIGGSFTVPIDTGIVGGYLT